MQCLAPLNDIVQIKVHDVVARDDIWVNILEEVPPRFEQVLFLGERNDSGPHDGGATA
eukprot:CAMPEP_0202978846 /NCGR_PEP_ID=MMETSP1396-20130829/85158_1 /ASSEMBLY_ACC=CAM_ASM_000872 /TAXON_ID= /ORGANISM="Pseudokeronopsis sp., Strain Brazil" /LENGTH=57 /DNA_ID=CAMNT_0049718005 /DNA_START=2122 /DNA_END=2295 /DNA_ORIENTATION=+